MKTQEKIISKGIEILIVEDSPTQAKYLRHLLEEGGYTVAAAANGKQAFVALREHKPTLIISDIVMPEMDGYELCRQIRADKDLKDIPVILLTALSDPADVIKGLECGANNFLTKPFDRKYLLSRIDYIFSNLELRKEATTEMGINVFFGGKRYFISAERLQILDLLLGTYETAVQRNGELRKAQDELKRLNEQLEQKVKERTAHLSAEITERKRVEEALREREAFNFALFQYNPMEIIVVDLEGKVVNINLAKRGSGDRLPNTGDVMYKDYAGKHEIDMHAELTKCIRSEKTREFAEQKYDERFLSITIAPFSQGAIIISRDITEHKRAEDMLRETEERYRTFIETSHEIIQSVRPDGHFDFVNKAWHDILGYTKKELSKLSLFDIIHPESLEYCKKLFKKVLAGESVKNIEAKLMTKDGSTVFVEGNAAGRYIDGKLVATQVFFRDITERERAEEALKKAHAELEIRVKERTAELKTTNETLQAEIVERKRAEEIAKSASRAKSDFLSSMSHELRTPLNAIIGFSQMMQEQYVGKLNEKQAEYTNDILESGKHLLSLINDILDLSKVEAGKMELRLSNVKIKELLENSLIMIKEKCLKHGIKLDLHIAQELDELEITADERKVKQIMFNLLSNAAKFTPDGGKIAVEAKQEEKEFIISVSDTGIGIAPEHQEEIFEEFHQINGGLMGKTPGTGLGLPLTKNFVEMHGGRIWVKSEGEGKGSRFSFSLPLKR